MDVTSAHRPSGAYPSVSGVVSIRSFSPSFKFNEHIVGGWMYGWVDIQIGRCGGS